MCGRFALFASGAEVAEWLHLVELPSLDARYNITPSQAIATVHTTSQGRALVPLRWGFIPSWSINPAIGNKLINAKAESVMEKAVFRSAFKYRRCLIPASGYYEWEQRHKGPKQPYFIRPREGGLFAFAGLWERWKDLETCTILTTESNELIQPLYDRMPVILPKGADDLWLNPTASPTVLRTLLMPYPSNQMEAYPVSPWVNNSQHEGQLCLESVGIS